MSEEVTVTLSREEYSRLRPSWAKSVILAQLEHNESDIQTDYFGSRTEQVVVLGWSRHERDLFPEMRQAAALFPPTADLGPGLDRYTPRVVFVNDVRSGGYARWAGAYSPWHRELYGESYNPPTFTTLAEAQAFTAAAGEPEPVSCDGEIATFKWDIEHKSVEHREKWSMGHGYYLAAGSKYSGWQVRKGAESWTLQGDRITVAAHLVTPRAVEPPAEVGTINGVEVRLNPAKQGIELRFPAKPAASILTDLKLHGWRWSRFAACWYHHDNQAARLTAARISGQPLDGADEGHAPDLDRMIEDAGADITHGPWEE